MADQTAQRSPKSTADIIDAVLPEPSDFVEGHDGRFSGSYDQERGVVTITFQRQGEGPDARPDDPGMTPSECAVYGVDDVGSGSVQLVERDHLYAALVELFSKPVAIRYYERDSWAKVLGPALFGDRS
jgi:hypothetical protein